MTVGLDHQALYSGALDVLLPECRDPVERDLRCRLMRARDVAQSNLANTDGHVQTLNLLIVETAGAFVFASVDAPTIKLAVEQCRRLMSAAAGAEELSI